MWLTIPCYNEAERLDAAEVDRLLEDPRVDVLFVDDGSTDGTRRVLEALVSRHRGRARVLALEVNGGKGEAVRRGMLEALALGSPIVGYLDADFATPPSELVGLLEALERSRAKVVLGARIARLGAAVERNPVRHLPPPRPLSQRPAAHPSGSIPWCRLSKQPSSIATSRVGAPRPRPRNGVANRIFDICWLTQP